MLATEPQSSGLVTTPNGMASLSAPWAGITMATVTEIMNLTQPQPFTEFPYILFITLKSSGYRKHICFHWKYSLCLPFDSAASPDSCTTCALLLPLALCYASSHWKAHHYRNGRKQVPVLYQ
jgi:hypothetical protein